MSETTDLLGAVNNLISGYGVVRDDLIDYLTGTADGGPNGDGFYPITLQDGVTQILRPCPARQILELQLDIIVVTATPFTLTAAHNGKTLLMSSAANMTLRLPNNLPVGFRVGVIEDLTGRVTFTGLAGATVSHRQGYTKTAGVDAVAAALVKRNANGTSAQWVLSGDLVA
ncbi:MAG TPA: hypothetical protein DEP91_04410 [Sphingomonas bacterium]|jgi:hypothetical protein|uniref:Uncharacterized protein n=1 Tax=Sphingomonas bacterium TaxID=1895847 RepID=A0A3D0W9I1_9SPHN|nr:hypothetical protein [Sphingomonas bacterium]